MFGPLGFWTIATLKNLIPSFPWIVPGKRSKLAIWQPWPKADHLRGRVYLCPDCFSESSSSIFRSDFSEIFFPHESLTLNGRHFGERFGHSVCAVNLDGDRFDDLVVGAPLYSEKNRVGIWA